MTDYNAALGRLRETTAQFRPGHRIYDEIVAKRDAVLARFQPIFSVGHIDSLTRDEYTPFLYLENNHHWSGLYRKGLGTAADMGLLRATLRVLLNEEAPIGTRFTEAVSKINGFGKGLATAILLVAYPDRYGVWNNTSELGLRKLGLWPTFANADGPGGRYERVNQLLVRLARDLELDLWTLDALWWALVDPERAPGAAEGETVEAVESVAIEPGDAGTNSTSPAERFALERQLEDFLLENWPQTPLGKEWSIHSTPEDEEAGRQFPTEVGPIDILARHRKEPRWLVIELKRNQSSDKTVGQVLRYCGWVKRHLAAAGESVEGLIIAHRADPAAKYAISLVPQVKLMVYEVSFVLRPEALEE